MEFEKIEQLISALKKDFDELRYSHPESALLKDKLKQNLIDLYEEVQNWDLTEKRDEEIERSVHAEEEKVIKLNTEINEELVENQEVMEEEPNTETVKFEQKRELVTEMSPSNQEGSYQMSMLIEDQMDSFEEEAEEVEEEKIVDEEPQKDMADKVINHHENEVKDSFEAVSVVQKHRVEHNDVLNQFKSKPIEKLVHSIPIGKKFEFIEDLFIGNSDEYQKAIESIDSMADYKEAEEFLMINYFDKFDWTEKEKVLNSLFDFVTRRFAA